MIIIMIMIIIIIIRVLYYNWWFFTTQKMLNIGYTLIYHKSIDDECWVGRTVNLIFRPGICSARTILQPVIEWKTMEGGKSNTAETRTMKLLNIAAISRSNNDNSNARDNGGDQDEFDCFFTITSQDGDIYLFEALNSNDSKRIVSGIKYNAYLLSNLLIEGNAKALLMADFYDNSEEPEQSRLTSTEVMSRLSHAFLDGL